MFINNGSGRGTGRGALGVTRESEIQSNLAIVGHARGAARITEAAGGARSKEE